MPCQHHTREAGNSTIPQGQNGLDLRVSSQCPKLNPWDLGASPRLISEISDDLQIPITGLGLGMKHLVNTDAQAPSWASSGKTTLAVCGDASRLCPFIFFVSHTPQWISCVLSSVRVNNLYHQGCLWWSLAIRKLGSGKLANCIKQYKSPKPKSKQTKENHN